MCIRDRFILLATLIVIPFSKSSFRPFGLRNELAPINQIGVTVQSHLSMTATPIVTGGPTATSTIGTSQARLKLCSKPVGTSFSAIRICGYNFTPDDKVKLTITTVGGQTKTLHTVLVDEQGTFQETLKVSRCKDYSASISAQDLTHPSEVILQLQNNDGGQCIVSTSIPMVPVYGKY